MLNKNKPLPGSAMTNIVKNNEVIMHIMTNSIFDNLYNL